MLDLQLSIQIEDPFAGQVSDSWLRRVASATLTTAGVASRVELGLVIAGDSTVRELNRTYRGIDNNTDVLAFALSESPAGQDQPFILPPDDIIHLGEIMISHPQATAQANSAQHPLERELALLMAHGILHLLGYDHQRPEDELEMRALEARAIEAIDPR